MPNAVIHTQTRVIIRVTTDENHKIGPGESIVRVSNDIDLSPVGDTRFWKLDQNNTMVPATVEEARAARVDYGWIESERRNHAQAMRAAVADIATNGATLPRLKAYFDALNNLNNA